jgi:hypothetical protein
MSNGYSLGSPKGDSRFAPYGRHISSFISRKIGLQQFSIFRINPVVALNSALGFIKPLTIEAQPLNQCNPLDHPNGDLRKVSSKWWKPLFYGGMQLIQPHLYATTG